MNREQEYVKFWLSIRNKCDEVQKDYSTLSVDNKRRVDNIGRQILSAITISEIVNIINSQIKG